ncbi:MAG: hypothetical protein IPG18_08420 [Saprospiraceae bacterium]|nr:hypothetical protein [Saprospiraceae bacterium]MBK6565212.1 hypothetical protein [Saprospiraceae bacterium]MBK6785869.1 hypothetical protein [Saprospiraceae bacterium]MBK8373196.1 hypothetical protein [Saprospiraceae bacterium]
MKTCYFLLITSIVFLFSTKISGQRTAGSVEIEIEVGDVEVDVDVEFGRKKFDCTKFGICSVSGDVGPKSFSTLSYNTKSGQLVFKVKIEGLKANQPDKIQYFEGKKTVSIEEEWELPESLRLQLKMPAKFKCKVGSYALEKRGEFYFIGFKV